MEKEKSIDEKIFELRNTLKILISESGLNVSVVELIVHEVYLEVKALSEQNLRNRLQEKNNEKGGDEDG